MKEAAKRPRGTVTCNVVTDAEMTLLWHFVILPFHNHRPHNIDPA